MRCPSSAESFGNPVRQLAVYVHVPFCTVKCGYCDFNVYAGMDAVKISYAEAVVAEAVEGAADAASRRTKE